MSKKRTKTHKKIWIYVNILTPAIADHKIAIDEHNSIIRTDGEGVIPYSYFNMISDTPFRKSIIEKIFNSLIHEKWLLSSEEIKKEIFDKINIGLKPYSPISFVFGHNIKHNKIDIEFEDEILKKILQELEESELYTENE